MKINNKYIITTTLLTAIMLLTACERTELCYNHYPTAGLRLSWEHEWERDYGMAHKTNWDSSVHGFGYDNLRPGMPEWVNLVKYRDNSTAGEHYLAPDGGDVMLTDEDGHTFLLYNGDTEYIVLSDMASLATARASATPRSRASISYIKEKYPDTRSANAPDVLYSAFIEKVPSIKNHEVKEIPVKMQPLVYTYVVRYEFEYGLEHVVLSRGALAGMAESVYLRDGKTSDESIIILYDCDVTDFGCGAHVRSFGVPGFPDQYYGKTAKAESYKDRTYTLNLEVLLKNGRTYEFNYDVSDQIMNQPRGGVITVKGIRIEDEQSQGVDSSGNFDVDLSGWAEEDVNLPLPPYN